MNRKCDHHPDREATHTNNENPLTFTRLAIWYYCAECADTYLTERGKEHYSRDFTTSQVG